jgi:Terpene synthase family 2, C-terminal metal binding
MDPTAIPAIDLPFPARQHPEAEIIEEHVRAWADQFQLVRSDATARALAHNRFGVFSACTYPTAPLPEAELGADWLAWLFLADDQYEEGAYGSEHQWTGVARAVRAVLEPDHGPGALADAPLIRALADLSRRFDALASPARKQRLTGHLLDTMASVFREIQLRENGTPPLPEYITLRRHCGGVIPCFDLIEICAHVALPAEVYHSPIYQEIILAGTDIVCWINDLYSLEKEVAWGSKSNIVLVLQHEREIDQRQAFSAARTLIGERVNDLLSAEQSLPTLARSLRLDTGTGETVRRCVAGVLDWVAGSSFWHHHGTARYRQPPGTVEDLLTTTAC